MMETELTFTRTVANKTSKKVINIILAVSEFTVFFFTVRAIVQNLRYYQSGG